MNKYDNVLNKLGRGARGLFMIIVMGLGFAVAIPLLLIMQVGSIGLMLALITVPFGGFFMLQGINIMILNGSYRSTGVVKEGQSTVEAVKTAKYTRASMLFCFLGFLTFVAISIYSIVMSIFLVDSYKIIMIICAVVSIVLAIIYFLMAGSRHENLKHNINIEEESK